MRGMGIGIVNALVLAGGKGAMANHKIFGLVEAVKAVEIAS